MARPARIAALVVALWITACGGQADRTGPAAVADTAMARGPATAPVTILEFSDYQWPYCKRAQQVLGQVMAEFPGQVRLVYRDFPLDFHPAARPAAEAARCAAAMGRFWEYHDLLFVGQPDFARDRLVTYAVRLGLDRAAFASCLDSGRFRAAVDADIAEGRARGVRGTPTFFVNGRRLVGAQPIAAFRDAIRDALDQARR